MNRIADAASRRGVSFEEMNKVVCGVDHQMRVDLEKKYGFKTREIEVAILSDAIKIISEDESKSTYV
jgi:hypothetical protein